MYHEDTCHRRYHQRSQANCDSYDFFVTMMLNAVPATLGFSKVYSRNEIVTQRKLNMNKDCRVHFGTYVDASKDAQITNTMKLRTE